MVIRTNWEDFKEAIRPEEHIEKGCVRSIIKDDLYPNLEVQAVTPKYYYNKRFHSEDEYSRMILRTKESGKDESAYFEPFVKECLSKFSEDLKLNEIDFITLIPNGNNKYFSNIINISKLISINLKKPVVILFDRDFAERSPSRDRLSRYRDLHEKFHLKSIDVSGKTILLIDDIRSSGISVLECAQVLKKGGASHIVAFALGTNNSDDPKNVEAIK